MSVKFVAGLALALLVLAGVASADDGAVPVSPTAKPSAVVTPIPSPWKNSLVASLGLSQAHYSNWVAGGQNSLAWTANLNGSSVLTEPLYSWANDLKLAYGQSSLGGVNEKVADQIHADSIYTQILNKWVNPFASIAWDTQFQPGYEYNVDSIPGNNIPVSKFMDPGYLVESLGAGTTLGKVDVFTARLGAAAKQTFANGPYDTVTVYTPNGESVYDQYGVNGMLGVKLSLAQNLLFTSEVDAFSNFSTFDNIAGTWDSLLTAKVNSWMSANVTCDVIYNNIQSTAGQLYEGLSLSFSYSLI